MNIELRMGLIVFVNNEIGIQIQRSRQSLKLEDRQDHG